MEGGGRYVHMCEEMCGELRLQNNFGTNESNLANSNHDVCASPLECMFGSPKNRTVAPW